MTENISFLTDFLKNSLTAHHAQDNVKTLLENNGFISLSETEDWDICQSGNYFVTRGASLIAFTVGGLDNFSFKIAASHLDSPALKIKENPLIKTANCVCLNTESYGGGLWYSFLYANGNITSGFALAVLPFVPLDLCKAALAAWLSVRLRSIAHLT